MQQLKYKRILIKLSGEALMGESNIMFDPQITSSILAQIKNVINLGVEVGIVIGGGNIFRGVRANELGLQRANADYMGMLATVMNGIALKDFLHTLDVKSEIYSALHINNIVKAYNRDSMLSKLIDGHIIIFVGGTGNPFFTTDSGAALRAIEMDANILIKATKVDGVYDKDPIIYPDAKKYNNISFNDAITQHLKIMDISAFDLCRAHNMNIHVCNIFEDNALKSIVTGEQVGTFVHY
ncbi:MAG: UMP kinase [Neisseriaceae bacterium]